MGHLIVSHISSLFYFLSIMVHFFDLKCIHLSQSLGAWICDVSEATQTLFLFCSSKNLLNTSLYWKLETELSVLYRDHKVVAHRLPLPKVLFLNIGIWMWHRLFFAANLFTWPCPSNICLLTIFARFSPILLEAAVFSLLCWLLFLYQTAHWWSI